ncbi:MAG TPA: glycosyltransferase family 4 protein [Vicinamibacterales bacterium]|nr:glycosyltransferase family 4 protein [Vicinamibacterales bacterium]
MTPEDPGLRQVRDDIDATLKEIDAVVARQREVSRDTAEAAAVLATLKASYTWKSLEAYRAARLYLRAKTMRWRGLRARAVSATRNREIPRAVRELPMGVNIAGYLSTESGMGEAARATIRSMEAAGVPMVLTNVGSRLRTQDLSYSNFTDDNPHPFNVVHLNGDNMSGFAAARGRAYFRDRYTIGYWFWELSKWRDDWLDGFNYVDEVWVASEFTRACLAEVSPVPIVTMPLPFVLPEPPPIGRAHFGLREDATVFLLTFDVSSQTERKNPLGAIRAFRRAALPRGSATLVLKYTNAEYDRDAVRRFHEEAEGLDVSMFDGYMSRPELTALMNASDCYLSLHRGEGFGMTMGEAMLLGKPVIATRYSGNVDFMTPDNSYLVDYRIVPLTKDYGPYMRGFVWADPDIPQAAEFIREVALNRTAAIEKGQRARRDMEASRLPQHTGAAMRARLEAIRGANGSAR